MMPVMLTAEELAHLATIRGAAFDKSFLAADDSTSRGSAADVAELLATPRAAQDINVNVLPMKFISCRAPRLI